MLYGRVIALKCSIRMFFIDNQTIVPEIPIDKAIHFLHVSFFDQPGLRWGFKIKHLSRT